MNAGEQNPAAMPPPVSTFAGPVAELIAQRMLLPPNRPGLLAGLDHFEILRLLGGGGMGLVLLARDTRSGREVAIKLVRSDLVGNQQVVHRFLKEAGHLRRLQHTNIIPVLEISDRPEGPYFVMPFFENGSLAQRIKPGTPLDIETILNIAIPIADGLGFAHRSGIIHRDLKPANILLGANGQVCLADFGLARTMFNDTLVDVDSRHLEGTAPYMSPAVAAGNAEDTRCDIYSFGALLYEMLTGQPPYQGRGTKEILDQILAGPPKSITSLNPAADRGLVAVAETAMARELRDRYAEMKDALNDLQRVRQGETPDRHRDQANNSAILVVITIAALAVGSALVGLIHWHNRTEIVQPQPAAPPAAVVQTPVPSHPATTNAVSPPAPVVVTPAPIPPPPPTPVPVVAPAVDRLLTLAGQPGTSGYADGAGTQALFHLPNNLALDRSGNIYVADTANNVIRKIGPGGMVTTLAGLAGSHGSTDGAGGNARFWAPFGIAVDMVGNIYVADTGNNAIRKVTPSGTVSTLAGQPGYPGSDDGAGAKARFRNPWDVAVDLSGNVYVADMSNDAIRKISADGQVSTLAGKAGESGSVDGLCADARFDNPFAVAVDRANNVYVSDTGNNTIRKISPVGVVATLAGLAGYAGSTDGHAEAARFTNPQGLAMDTLGNLFVADTGNNSVRKIVPGGNVSTVPDAAAAKNGNDQPDLKAGLNNPGGVAVDAAGNIFVADTNNHCVRKINAPAAVPGL